MRGRGPGQPERRPLAMRAPLLRNLAPPAASNGKRSALTSRRSQPGVVFMKALRLIAIALAATLTACTPAKQDAKPAAGGLTPIRFATDWRAEAEHGGFYEALANGEYKKRG